MNGKNAKNSWTNYPHVETAIHYRKRGSLDVNVVQVANSKRTDICQKRGIFCNPPRIGVY